MASADCPGGLAFAARRVGAVTLVAVASIWLLAGPLARLTLGPRLARRRQDGLTQATHAVEVYQRQSFTLVIPGHRDTARTKDLVDTVVYVARSVPAHLRFECLIFTDVNISVEIPAPYSCTVARHEGHWTELVKTTDINSTYTAIIMDGVSPRGVRLATFLDTMRKYGLDVAAPSQAAWHREVMMPDVDRSCTLRYTKLMDVLFTVFTRSAWACWRRHIDVESDSPVSSVDATFNSTCGVRMAVLNKHRAYFEDGANLSASSEQHLARRPSEKVGSMQALQDAAEGAGEVRAARSALDVASECEPDPKANSLRRPSKKADSFDLPETGGDF